VSLGSRRLALRRLLVVSFVEEVPDIYASLLSMSTHCLWHAAFQRRGLMDAASDRVPVTSRTPATKAKMAQRIVRSAHEGITDAHQLVAAAVAEGMVPAL
jgi:hypothetical protein